MMTKLIMLMAMMMMMMMMTMTMTMVVMTVVAAKITITMTMVTVEAVTWTGMEIMERRPSARNQECKTPQQYSTTNSTVYNQSPTQKYY